MSDRILYTGKTDTYEFREHYHSGRVISEDGQFWLAQYNIAYSQQGVCTSDTFTCREKADAKFDERLAAIRKCWGKNGFTETDQSSEMQPRRIRFRSLRKNGKPGTLTGILYMTNMKNVTERINAV